MNAAERAVREVCLGLPGVLPAEKLSPRKKAYIGRSLGIRPDDGLLVFFESSRPGRQHGGVAFCRNGMYWKTTAAPLFFDWELLGRNAFIRIGKKPHVLCLHGHELSVTGLRPEREQWIDALYALKEALGLNPVPSEGPLSPRQRHLLEERSPAADIRFIRELCRRSGLFPRDRGLASGEREPNARRDLFRIPPSETLFAFYDTGWFARGRRGLALTDVGLYLRDAYPAEHGLSEYFLPYSRMDGRRKLEKVGYQIGYGDTVIYFGWNAEAAFRLFRTLLTYVSSLHAEGAEQAAAFPYAPSALDPWDVSSLPESADGAEWLVSDDGMVRGFHTAEEIERAIRAGRLRSEAARFFRYGETRWLEPREAGISVPL
ncbi:hypothetical protein [Saccharibacillus alkalitolerans]|uniref:Uncharacterized protein n=1 Tax=Saccharibacillus alkalitolerans TaxID=2705290 RepID=A0ABX0FB07_9BACL|nr:hypothetical protein [Saccharibacillus alkalitolerans]NGZ77545.1 hypothetical protein [Saccharibacillus alkalitolerans]